MLIPVTLRHEDWQMKPFVLIAGAAVTAVGLLLWIAIATAVRRKVFALDRDLVFSPGFSLFVLAVAGASVLLMLRGVEVALAGDSRFFAFVEAPLILLVGGLALRLASTWRVLGDVFPRNGVKRIERLPVVVATLVNLWSFYAITALIASALLAVFVRRRPHVGVLALIVAAVLSTTAGWIGDRL